MILHKTEEQAKRAIVVAYISIICVILLYIWFSTTGLFQFGFLFDFFLTLSFLLWIIFALYGVYIGKKSIEMIDKMKEKRKILKEKYFESLRGTDKSLALQLGRTYYGSLREDGIVTIYDEQAITNDLNSMKNTVNIVNALVHKVENEYSEQKTLYCQKCGKAYVPKETIMFCGNCGNKL